jgi:hypothetical protein
MSEAKNNDKETSAEIPKQTTKTVIEKASEAITGDDNMMAGLLKMLFNPIVLITAIIVGFLLYKNNNKQKDEIKTDELDKDKKKYKKLKRKNRELQEKNEHEEEIRRKLYEKIRSLNEDKMLNKHNEFYKQSSINGTKTNKISTAYID